MALNEDPAPAIVTAIPTVPVTEERLPFVPSSEQFYNPGTARANIAASEEHPDGTTKDGYARRHHNQTVLQQHVSFFDFDKDGVIWPHDTFRGFHLLGFNILLSLVAALIINTGFSYPTSHSYIPDPFFRVHVDNINKVKHGSDSGTYDNEGRFIPQKFEDLFSKYAKGKDGLTIWDILDELKGQRALIDPFGSFAAVFEWIAVYIMFWPEDGIIKKDDIRRVFDGSIFYEIAARRKNKSS